MTDVLPLAVEAIVSFFLVVATFFAVSGAIGLVRLPDFFTRLHAPTKASTLGVGGALLASLVHFAAAGSFGLKELAVAVFVFITAPVSANLLAKAALHRQGDGAAEAPSAADHDGKAGDGR
jgi:multicomponent K+:H+ antiporter subunit G